MSPSVCLCFLIAIPQEIPHRRKARYSRGVVPLASFCWVPRNLEGFSIFFRKISRFYNKFFKKLITSKKWNIAHILIAFFLFPRPSTKRNPLYDSTPGSAALAAHVVAVWRPVLNPHCLYLFSNNCKKNLTEKTSGYSISSVMIRYGMPICLSNNYTRAFCFSVIKCVSSLILTCL